MNTISKLRDKLKDPEYRKAFVASQINIGIPFQIRALLQSRDGWTQETLAERTGMLQPRISGLMTPGKTRPNIETLRRVADGFDCGLLVWFVPFSELVRWAESFDPESFNVPKFDDDMGLFEYEPAAQLRNPGLNAPEQAAEGIQQTPEWTESAAIAADSFKAAVPENGTDSTGKFGINTPAIAPKSTWADAPERVPRECLLGNSSAGRFRELGQQHG